jgi:hypothetical protein
LWRTSRQPSLIDKHMNIEQELITAINMLLDEASAKGEAFTMTDIARAAIERCGAARVPLEAVADLARQVYIRKNEPWMALPGTKPRLKEGGDGVVPLAHKPTVMEILAMLMCNLLRARDG